MDFQFWCHFSSWEVSSEFQQITRTWDRYIQHISLKSHELSSKSISTNVDILFLSPSSRDWTVRSAFRCGSLTASNRISPATAWIKTFLRTTNCSYQSSLVSGQFSRAGYGSGSFAEEVCPKMNEICNEKLPCKMAILCHCLLSGLRCERTLNTFPAYIILALSLSHLSKIWNNYFCYHYAMYSNWHLRCPKTVSFIISISKHWECALINDQCTISTSTV